MTRIVLNFGLCLALCGALAQALSSGCSSTNKTERFAVPGQCDAYIECVHGQQVEMLCPDGLLFNEKSSGYPCGYPIDVQCEQRTKTQNAQPTDDCPHQFGYYRIGDKSNCGTFKNCASGVAHVLECPEGLAWNAETYQCDWPDLVADCDAEAYLGFKCPQIAKSNLLGDEEYRFYISPSDCSKYFICINGQPRINSCGEGYGFNPEINACDGLENITCSGSVRNAVKPEKFNAEPQRPQANNYQSGNSYQQPAQAQRPAFQQQPQRGGGAYNQGSYQQKPFQQQSFQNAGRPNNYG
ncbi:protein obstructor-E-like isoform X1 [Episyrphus balteatus]|uniref:protein obstructor-E-like isoform X1 n=1 Tax=Episyrphus balteatus TaxID=286459 RepID=UPI002485A6E1|nr:protein obstructor-E-like isoform X1 [Episyrphus balteatus]